MKVLEFIPGATPANTNIPLPFGVSVRQIVKAFKLGNTGGGGGHTHDIASGTTAVTSTAANGSGIVSAHALTVDELPSHNHITELSVVSDTPGSGEIQLVDKHTIQLGDAINDGEALILYYIGYGEIPGY